VLLDSKCVLLGGTYARLDCTYMLFDIQYQRKNVTISHHIKSNNILTSVVVRRGVA
jgi:hypothetical protein